MWLSCSKFQPEGKTALIVGASQGLGADLALKLYEKDCSVILVARTEAKLQKQVDRILNTTKENSKSTTELGDNSKNESNFKSKSKSDGAFQKVSASYFTCDVSNYDACERMWHTLISERNVDPDYIFCCAGSSIPKLFGDLTGAELAAGINTNYLTAVNTVHAGHKAVIKSNPGTSPSEFKPRHVILFSSTVASFPFIGYGQYAPSKAALSSLSIILRQELVAYNYRVSCVYPGNFESEGYTEEQKTKPEITKKIEGASVAIPSLQCCDIIINALAKGYDSIYTDFIGWVLASSVLGVTPRCWGFFQILVSFLFSIVAPIANIFIYMDIRNSFKEGDKKTAVKGDVNPKESSEGENETDS